KNIFDGKELSQWDWAVNCLKRDKDSRQAIIHYNTPDHQTKNNKDFVCTLYNQFFIREDRLFLQYFMRSQDVIRGITFDFPWGWTLLKTMQLSLLDVYPNLKIGSYIHTCGSFHLYNEHYSLVRDFLEEKTTGDKMPDINIDLIDNPDLHRIYNKKEPVQKDEFLKFLKNNY
ncbi:MAG: thymidylate synthase, partial [Nanoarchaeota archaeon]